MCTLTQVYCNDSVRLAACLDYSILSCVRLVEISGQLLVRLWFLHLHVKLCFEVSVSFVKQLLSSGLLLLLWCFIRESLINLPLCSLFETVGFIVVGR